MQFIIYNRNQMKDYKCNKKHLIISIKDPETEDSIIAQRDDCVGILYLAFHDFDDLSKDYPGRIVLFSKEHAKEILDFVAYPPVKVDIIICQCEAGISRSAGVAGALSKIINGDDKAIFRQYLPNSLVYRTILNEAYKQGISNIYLRIKIEKAIAKVDNFEDYRQHKNLLGNKNKYIDAILEELENEEM